MFSPGVNQNVHRHKGDRCASCAIQLPAPRPERLPAAPVNVVPDGKLERNSVITKCVRLVTVPLLNVLPEPVIKTMMTRSSLDASTVVAKGGSAHALEAMYTRYHRTLFSRGPWHGLADSFWHHVVAQPRALRNRLKIVRQILKTETTRLIQECQHRGSSEPVRILSIAGGSSRSIIQTIVDLKAEGLEHPLKVVTVDKDQSALDLGARLAQEAGVSCHFHWICGSARDMGRLFPGKKFHLIEIVGLLDYLSEPRAVRLLKDALALLNKGGAVIAANVIPNAEMPFVHKTGWPRMIYRTPKDFLALFERAGFSNTEFMVEPLGVHCIAIARK